MLERLAALDHRGQRRMVVRTITGSHGRDEVKLSLLGDPAGYRSEVVLVGGASSLASRRPSSTSTPCKACASSTRASSSISTHQPTERRSFLCQGDSGTDIRELLCETTSASLHALGRRGRAGSSWPDIDSRELRHAQNSARPPAVSPPSDRQQLCPHASHLQQLASSSRAFSPCSSCPLAVYLGRHNRSPQNLLPGRALRPDRPPSRPELRAPPFRLAPELWPAIGPQASTW